MKVFMWIIVAIFELVGLGIWFYLCNLDSESILSFLSGALLSAGWCWEYDLICDYKCKSPEESGEK